MLVVIHIPTYSVFIPLFSLQRLLVQLHLQKCFAERCDTECAVH